MSVRQLQLNLQGLGLDPGPVDGLLGGRTLQALAGHMLGKPAPEGVGPVLWTNFKSAAIFTRLRILHFMAQVAHESGFEPREENLSYSAKRIREVWPTRFPTVASAEPYAKKPERLANKVYGNRMGNTKPGDGWRFRGRGWAQHTGRDGYEAVGASDNPDVLLTLEGAAKAAVAFWQWKGLTFYADQDDIEAITIKWNGGLVGMADRRLKLQRGKAVWP